MIFENFTTFKSHFSKNRHSIFALLNNHLVDYPTPLTLTYLWGLGSAAGIFLGLQIITGLVLTMHYAPQVNIAFDLLEHIMRDVNNGWLWRFLHANGASFFFALIYLHIGRGLYYFSNIRNPFPWISGMVLFGLMMATAFMGYVLPWGQMSFWGATVITNLFSAIPIIGQDIAFWLWGGFSVDNPTLNRFYTLHFLLPFAILGVAGLHLILLHRPGSTNPIMIFDKSNDKIPFFPYFYWKDLTGFFIIIIFYAFFVFFCPDALGHPDNYIEGNPMITPTHIVPEWYFLPFYAILRSIPNKLGGVALMAASILILFFITILSSIITEKNKRGTEFIFFLLRKNNFFQFFIWFFFFTVIFLGWIGSQPVTEAIVYAGQLNTVIYFAWFIYFPLFAVLPLVDALEIFFFFSIFKKSILMLGGIAIWISKKIANSIPAQTITFTTPFFYIITKTNFWNFFTETCIIICSFSALFFIYTNYQLNKTKIKKYPIFELIFFIILSLFPLIYLLIDGITNWINFYLLFEISALSTSVLLLSKRYNPYVISASISYFFISILVSIFLLLGIYFLYLELGTFYFFNIPQESYVLFKKYNFTSWTLLHEYFELTISIREIGAILILFSLMVKIGITPFHGWMIGANSGTSLHITAYLQTFYKTALFILFIVLTWKFHIFEFINTIILQQLFVCCGFLTLLVCGLATLIQTSFKPFWAYLSNATIGFLFILLGINEYVLALLYLFFYFLLSFFFFCIILITTTNTYKKLTFLYLSDFKYLVAINIYYASLAILLLLTLAGLPPLPLFFIKFIGYFLILKSYGFVVLSGIVCLHVITTFLYLKIIKIIAFTPITLKMTNNISKFPRDVFMGTKLDTTILLIISFILCYFTIHWDYLYKIAVTFFGNYAL